MADGPESLENKKLSQESRDLARQAKLNREEMERLTAAFKQMRSEGTLADKDVRELAKHLSDSRLGAKKLADAVDIVAGRMSEGSKVMSEASERSHQGVLRAMAAQANATKSASDRAVYHERIANLHQERFRTDIENRLPQSLANLRAGNVGSGIQGLMEHGLTSFTSGGASGNALATSIQNLTGIASEAARTIAMFGGIVMVMAEVISIVSKNMDSAAKSGYELGGSYESAAMRGAAYGLEVDKATRAFGVFQSMSQEQVAKLLESAKGQGVFGLAGVGTNYTKSIEGSGSARFNLRLQAVDFVAALAQSSHALGLGEEAAVKFGTEIGVLSHGSFRDAERGYTRLAVESQRLGISMDPLMANFQALAKAADFGGMSADKLVGQTLSVTDALEQMSKRGMAGLGNLDEGKITAVSQALMQTLMGVSSLRIAALTMTPGQTWEKTLQNAVDPNQFGLRREALQNAMNRAGVTDPTKMSYSQMFMVGKFMGVQGDVADITKMGDYLAALGGARLSKEAMDAKMASIIDQKFSEARSVGANIQAGSDPMQTVANTIRDLLKVVVELATFFETNVPHFYKNNKDTVEILRELRSGETQDKARQYSGASGGYRSNVSLGHS